MKLLYRKGSLSQERVVTRLGINEALEVKEDQEWWCFLFPSSPLPHSVREEGLVRDWNPVTESHQKGLVHQEMWARPSNQGKGKAV